MTVAATAEPESPLAVICGGGSLPFAVADAVVKRGRKVLMFGLRGSADAQRLVAYPHHWARLGQFGSFCRLASRAGCRDVVFIGSVVRPGLWQIRPDLKTLWLLPRVLRIFRGGDNHLLSGIAEIFEEHGFRLIGAHEVAAEILLPEGLIGRNAPDDRDRKDIAKGLALLNATSPFDIGQAAVVADERVLAIEAGQTILLDEVETIALADRYGLSVVAL